MRLVYHPRVSENSELEAERLKAQFQKRAQDFDDLQNEIAGRDVGRITRFTSEDARDGKLNGKRRATDDARMIDLQTLLMTDPAYAELYRGTANALHDAQSRLDELMIAAQKALDEAQSDLDETLAQAAQLPDGRHVFRDQNGSVRFEDGSAVPLDDADSVVWRGDEPTYEQFDAARERVGRIGEIITDIQIGQADIGDMQESMEDEDNPPSADDLREMQDRADGIVDGISQRLTAETALEQDTPSPDVPTNHLTAGISVPEL